MRSDVIKKGAPAAPNRSLLYALGYTKEELDVVNSSNHALYGAIVVHDDDCALGHVAVGVGGNGLSQNGRGLFLQILVQGGRDIDIIIALADIGINLIVDPVGKISGADNFGAFFSSQRHL